MNNCRGYYAQCQTGNVRSVVRMSSHRSGLSIYRIIVFATCGPATAAGINLKMTSILVAHERAGGD